MHLKTEEIIVFAGYRDWALSILENLQKNCKNIVFIHVETEASLYTVLAAVQVDAVFLAGWSWILPTSFLQNNFVIGLHPSDLPNYAGGSPLQHQILDGLTKTKMSLFEITPLLDHGQVFLKANLSLEGHMSDIFASMVESGSGLLIEAVTKLDNLKESSYEGTAEPLESIEIKKRLKPESSCLNKAEIPTLSTRDLYNKIRAREKPYPNVYIEDEVGRLYFRSVEFDPKA